jgi:SWI/SNF-related matrix-associated actin-dependent regulator 1 of chromatin subfamily A
MASLQHDGRRYVWSGTYAERLLPKEAGFRWDPDAKLWYTTDHRKAESLINYMAASALNARAAWKETLQASRATDSEIEIPAPEGLSYLPYQKAGIAYAASRKSVLIGDEMGLGKTIQALGLINLDTAIQTILVVAPKSLLLNWQREAEKWLTRTVELTIINYDMVWKRADLTERTWDLVVYDESQYLKNPKAKRTRASLAIPARRRVFLTGTPILNRPVELWPIVNAIDPEGLGRNFFGFAQRYCGAKQIRAGRKMVWDFTGASNLEELQDKMRQRFMVRRLKKDVLTELPAKRRQIIPLEANGASGILKAEKKLIEQLGFEEAARALEGQSAAFTEMAKLRHDLGVAKVGKAVEHIIDMLDGADKVIVFAHHHDVIDILKAGLEQFGCVTITGQTKDTDRQAAVDRFQTDPGCRVFVGNIKAAGVGLTLTAASTVVFVEQDWTPGWMAQAEDRAHRIGQTESVLVQYLVFDGSMDAVLAQTLVSKADISDRALDREVGPSER